MDGDEEHAHMDDSFLDDDECCPLSHDDDMPPDRCDDHPGNALATGLTSLSLREPDGTCISLVDSSSGDRRMSQSAMGAIQQHQQSSAAPSTASASAAAAGSSNPLLTEPDIPAAEFEDDDDDREVATDNSEILLVVLDDDEEEEDDDDDSRLFRDEDLSRSSTHSNRLHGSPSKGARHRRQQRQNQQQHQHQHRRRRAWETCVPKVVPEGGSACGSVEANEDYANESFEEDDVEEQRHVS